MRADLVRLFEDSQPQYRGSQGVSVRGYGNRFVLHSDAVPAMEEVAAAAVESTCSYAWTPTKTGNSGGNDLLVLNVGSVSGGGSSATVNIDGANILTNPTLEVPDTADTTQIVYLKIPVTKIKTANNFVYGVTLGTVTVEVATALPTSDQDFRYHELFRWRNGALLNQVGKYNVGVFCRDNGASNNFGVFTILTAG